MVANNSDLLAQINSILQETSFKEKYWNPNFSLIKKSMANVPNPVANNCPAPSKKAETVKLVERIRNLEEQNDQLLSVVHFLLRRFTELINNLDPSQTEEAALKCNMCVQRSGRKNGSHSKVSEKSKPLLTKREMDVFNLLAKGLCAKEIAKTLFISETTVITHKKNLKEKFSAKNTVELVSKAFRSLMNSNKTSFRFDLE